jgi:hypothetical protein
MARLRNVRSGWLELTESIPEPLVPALDDLSALRVNPRLGGSSRFARAWGSPRPYLRADVWVERVADVEAWTRATRADFADAVRLLVDSGERPRARAVEPVAVGDVERACAEIGWRVAAADEAGLRVEIDTRHGNYVARFESPGRSERTGPTPSSPRFVVDLLELSGRPEVCRRAAAALLMAVSGSVRLVKGAIADWGAALMVGLDAASQPDTDEALSALSVACEAAGREVQALMDERLASEYLALSLGAGREDAREWMEEEPCLQQQ